MVVDIHYPYRKQYNDRIHVLISPGRQAVRENTAGLEYTFKHANKLYFDQGWKLMSCSQCQELCQQVSKFLIGRVNNQSEPGQQVDPTMLYIV